MKIKTENIKFMCKVSCSGYYAEDCQDYSKMDMDSTDECMDFVKKCAIDYHHNYDGTLHYEIIPYIPSLYSHGSYNLSCSENLLTVYNEDDVLIYRMNKKQAKEFVE